MYEHCFILPVIVTLLLIHSAYAASLAPPSLALGSACSCAIGNVPVSVDVKLPIDPATQPLNTTHLRRLQTTYKIFGVFCQPSDHVSNIEQDSVQLLLHGSTYTSQYWTFPINGFQNYSYVAHACVQGQTTFAYDALGVGLSDRPVNSTDVQLPTAAAIASSLAHQLLTGQVTASLGLPSRRFRSVVALGHSQGSVVFHYVAVTEGSSSSFSSMILTGHIHDEGFLSQAGMPRPAARDVDATRWANLDTGYISSSNRAQYYSPDNSTFSQDLIMIDQLTKDVSTIWYTMQLPAVYVPAKGFSGSVVELVGAMDQIHCLNSGDGNVPCNATALQPSEAVFWPNSRNFSMIVREGSGHDVNLDFGAAETFNLFTSLVNLFTAL